MAGFVAKQRGLTLFANANDVGQARLRVIVAKRKVAKAVERNRIKRMVRSAFREQQGSLPCLDLVVVANSNARHIAKSYQILKLFNNIEG